MFAGKRPIYIQENVSKSNEFLLQKHNSFSYPFITFSIFFFFSDQIQILVEAHQLSISLGSYYSLLMEKWIEIKGVGDSIECIISLQQRFLPWQVLGSTGHQQTAFLFHFCRPHVVFGNIFSSYKSFTPLAGIFSARQSLPSWWIHLMEKEKRRE